MNSGGNGAAAGPAVSLAPASLTFSSQAVGTTSGAQTLTLTHAGDATLTITSLAVTGTNASSGAGPQALSINGANFLSTSTVTYNGVAHTATYVSATQLTITLSAGDQAAARTYPLVVTNPHSLVPFRGPTHGTGQVGPVAPSRSRQGQLLSDVRSFLVCPFSDIGGAEAPPIRRPKSGFPSPC